MDSLPSELLLLTSSLTEAARGGDWVRTEALVRELRRAPMPTDPAALASYLGALREALVAARIARTHLVATLHRISAAASFCNESA